MEEQKELRTSFREGQGKYVYYVIALCVTAIGFSIHQTSGKPLSLYQIPLGISVLLWGASIFCGLRFVAYNLSTLYANNEYFEIIQGKNKDVGNHPQMIQAAGKGIKEAMNYNVRRGSKFGKLQNQCFYFGSISFIIWHVLEMYKTTIR